MYAPRVSPIRRMRSGGRRESATRGLSPSPKRRSLSVATKSIRLNGDYQVLHQNVDLQRQIVEQARAALSSSLDQLGEHHVRQKEYDDAMDAFTEALHEKRSAFSHISPSPTSSDGNRSRTSSYGSSIFGEADPPQNGENQSEKYDQTIDQIVMTLRNMGNVHSLRGEQDEAMRYYTEVTNLRAQKTSANNCDPVTGEAKSLLSSMHADDNDNSTLMSEINEDVKALDDLFRSISFRNQANNNINTDLCSISSEKRKSKPLNPSPSNTSPSNKRQKSTTANHDGLVENEPFKRSTSSIGSPTLPATGNEMGEALDIYKSVLESYCGPDLEQRKENCNSLALRADLINENRKHYVDPMHDSASVAKVVPKAADLELTIEIYRQVLQAHDEGNKARQSENPDTERDQKASSNIASTLICMGSVYYKLGNRVEELRMYKEAKNVYRQTFGENHTFVAGTRKNIGMVLAERGEYAEATTQFDKAMRIYLSVNDGSDMNRDVASAISCMGNVKNRIGELDAALSQYMEALRIYKCIHEGAADSEGISVADTLRDVTSTLKVIGMVHAKKGDLDTAMGFFQEAMTLLRSPCIDSTTTGRETTASVLTRIASIHLKKGDLEEAMAHYREAYDLTVRNRGTTSHQEVAGILHYIGGIFHKRMDYDEAMSCYQEAIRIYHATLGAGNPTVAGTLVMVGSIYYKRRNLDSAMMFYREALRLNRDAYGMHHPDVAPILKSIGTILTKKGDYKEAYDIFRDVLSIKCTVHGTGHPEVASAYKSLGNVHYKLGDLADAERQYRHALSIYRRTKGEEHADTVSARTTIEHLRYWMREREQRQQEERHSRNTSRPEESDERSC
jgi:tetratricopeptide (TPR) repeat protein